MTDFSMEEELEELSSAEDFLNYFKIEYDAKVVHINRLHIMQRFHDYLSKGAEALDESASEEVQKSIYKTLLTRAYEDFVSSDAATEKVFKVFHMNEPQSTFVSVDQLMES